WTTFRLTNAGKEPHFFLLTRLPEGRTLEDYGREVGRAFGGAYDSLEAGTVDKAGAVRILGTLLPTWYGSASPAGGVGMVSPGIHGQATVRLDPGTYVMECYVKSPDGRFHSELGMIHMLVVTTDSSSTAAPPADLRAAVSNGRIEAPAAVVPGAHTIALHYAEQPEAGLGNDLHLVRLADTTRPDAVTRWMDWMELDGLRTPAPTEFLGGVQEMPAGRTAYFTVDVAPGRYAWVSERPSEHPMAKEFTVE
ncbi:MAG TPA: hypothetical protein VFZ26_14285, partial [Gemmatimonadales bacterium]